MNKACKNCGSRHWTALTSHKEKDHCNRCPATWKERIEYTVFLIITVLVVGLVLGGPMALYGQWAYDDWTCAFKNCRVVKIDD